MDGIGGRSSVWFDTTTVHPRVALAYLEHMWAADAKVAALHRLKHLLDCVTNPKVKESLTTSKGAFQYSCDRTLLCDLYLRQGEWLQHQIEGSDVQQNDSSMGMFQDDTTNSFENEYYSSSSSSSSISLREGKRSNIAKKKKRKKKKLKKFWDDYMEEFEK